MMMHNILCMIRKVDENDDIILIMAPKYKTCHFPSSTEEDQKETYCFLLMAVLKIIVGCILVHEKNSMTDDEQQMSKDPKHSN